MTSEGLGEMFEGDSADMCTGKFPLMLMGGRAEGLAFADPGLRPPSARAEYSHPSHPSFNLKNLLKSEKSYDIEIKVEERLKSHSFYLKSKPHYIFPLVIITQCF